MLNIQILCDKSIIILLSRFSTSTRCKNVSFVRRAIAIREPERSGCKEKRERDPSPDRSYVKCCGKKTKKKLEDFFLPRIRHRKPRRTFTFVINVNGFAQRGDDSYALLSRVTSATEETVEKKKRNRKKSKRDSD